MRGFLTIVFCFLGAGLVLADVPQEIHYQGYLTDSAGTPIQCSLQNCDIPISMTFRLYEQAEGGESLWSETHNTVLVEQGVFHIILGLFDEMSAEMVTGDRWLGIEVNQQGEMFPRQQLYSAPFALRAALADHAETASDTISLGGLVADDFVQVGELGDFLTAENLLETLQSLGFEPDLNWTDIQDIPSDIADGDADALSALLCAAGELAKWDGTTWSCSDDIDTQLTEEQVDAFVENNGFALQTALDAVQANVTALDGELAAVAKTGDFFDLLNTPAGLADGDNDLLATLPCTAGQIARNTDAGWTCSDDEGGALPTAEPTPCDASSVGVMYFDVAGGAVRVCDGTTYRKIKLCDEICPIASTVACSLPLLDDCGGLCGGTGTGLNGEQCADPASFTCGTPIQDDCGNSCPSGNALDATECDAVGVDCGDPVQDGCGNDCSEDGTYCAASADKCVDGSCILACGDGVVDPGEACDDGDTDNGNGCKNDCSLPVFVFTTCGKAGRIGPSQADCTSAYIDTPLEGSVSVVTGIQTWEVPADGDYRIEVKGAQGGNANAGVAGGLGATLKGTFTLVAGTTLEVLVGQEGNRGPSCSDDCLGGGGGGTFVALDMDNLIPLIAAGGGGGANYNNAGTGGVTTETATHGGGMTSGAGTGGSGGSGSCSHWAGAGAGWLTEGTAKMYSCESTGSRAQPPHLGGEGGRGNDASTQTGEGGFGGGGGSAVECGQTGGGGGGGYSGGGASGCCSSMGCAGPGGGGGSFNDGTDQVGTPGSHSGHGEVRISRL